MSHGIASGDVVRVAACRLQVARERWPWADARRDEINAAWHRRVAAEPKYFNGAVRLATRTGITDGVFDAHFATIDFASFVYWWDTGFPDGSMRDCFGSAIVRSAEGHCLLGVQARGNLNAGRAYFPGGFIDAADVKPDSSIDIDQSIARELAEETGLEAAALRRTPGYILAAAGCSIAIGIEYSSMLPADELRAQMRAWIAAQAEPELADMLVVRAASDLDGRPVSPYVPLLVADLLANGACR